MKFRSSPQSEPEINLIAFIDVLLVVLIFLMLSTTYSKYTELQITLPTANADAQRSHLKEITVGVGADGSYSINQSVVSARNAESLGQVLAQLPNLSKDTVLVISADASAKHQAVITVMDAARRAGMHQITFATQSAASAAAP